MFKNVLVINGHPRKKSFSESIVAAYVSAAEITGVSIHVFSLSEQSFNPDVTHYSPKQQILEASLIRAQELILWADHIVFVYPTWWGTMPALLKGFIDRVFTEGFAFNEIEGGTGYAPLLSGKTAQIITTMDTPYLVYQLIYRAPGHNAMRRAILEFCGFELARTISLGPIKGSTAAQREKWLNQVRKQGTKLKYGALSPVKRLSVKGIAWLKAIRLQFYPMTAVAYVTGAWAAVNSGHPLQYEVLWFGYGWLFFLEVATVLINEKEDYHSDKENAYFGPFTGGSRVIVDRLLSFAEIQKGIILVLTLSFIMLFGILISLSGNYIQVMIMCTTLIVLALGYTAAPLKLSYRSLGEFTVGFTHSFAVILCGYLFMGGVVYDLLPWALGLPLFLGVLPSIILAGIPDHRADSLAEKKSIAVRLGKKQAARLAMGFTCLSALTIALFSFFNIYPVAFSGLIYVVIPHAVWLCVLLKKYLQHPNPPNRIDSLLIAALVYIVWFGLIPLINLA